MSFIIKGKASWAFIQKPNTKWDDQHRYEITLTVEKNIYDDFKSRVDFGGKYYNDEFQVNINTPTQIKGVDVENVTVPVCVDADAAPFTGLIGNGSEVLVKYRTFTYTRGQHKGKTRAYLEGVQIAELVPYEASDSNDEDGSGSSDDGGKIEFAPLKPTSPH